MRLRLVHYAIIGTVAYFGYLMFSDSSMDKIRKQIQAKRSTKLIEKITKSVSKKTGGSSIAKQSTVPTGTAMSRGVDTSADLRQEEENASQAGPNNRPMGEVANNITSLNKSKDRRAKPSMPLTGAKPMTNPYLNNAGTDKTTSTPEKASDSSGDSYYPPAPMGGRTSKKNNNSKPTSMIKKDQIFSPGYGLSVTSIAKGKGKGGKKEDEPVHMAFEGTRVYMLNENNEPVPFPDGYYRIGDSKAIIRVVDGQSSDRH